MSSQEDSNIADNARRAAHVRVATIPVGDDGVHYQAIVDIQAAFSTADDPGLPQAETLADLGARPWGPSALAVGSASELYIADTITGQVLQTDANGVVISRIDMSSRLVAVDDVKVLGNQLWVLDQAAEQPQLFRLLALVSSDSAADASEIPGFSFDPETAERIPLVGSLSDTQADDASGDAGPALDIGSGVTGIAIDEEGILIEYGHGARLFRPSTAEADPTSAGTAPELQSVDGYRFHGRTYRAIPADPMGNDPSTGFVMVDDQSIPIKGLHSVLKLRILGANADGSFYVVVDDVTDDTIIQDDQTVRHYAEDGTLLGIARVPLRERATYVPNSLALGPDGAVYMLMTRPDTVEIQRVTFVAELPPLPPITSGETGSTPSATEMGDASDPAAAAPNCQPRDTMIALGFKYRDNRCNLSNKNINGSCPGRVRPHYLDHGPGEYGSVAYDWGGFDTVEQYNTFMAQGFQAGDMPTSRNDPPTQCSKGVDCSGFVSRCWGLKEKKGTSNIKDVSFAIKRSQLKPGDILNLAGSHVTLFHHSDGEGIWAFESTAWGHRDRVIFRPHGPDYYDGFEARRFNNVC